MVKCIIWENVVSYIPILQIWPLDLLDFSGFVCAVDLLFIGLTKTIMKLLSHKLML